VHLGAVYAAGETAGTAYAVVEWTGGVSIADRIRAGAPVDAVEFLPNAAGLAAGLAALHAGGAVHGAIDTGAIAFAAAHPAKLVAFGRPQRSTEPSADTAELATALHAAIAGDPSDGLDASEATPELSPAVDDALGRARRGGLEASGLAAALRAIPPAVRPASAPWSWRWLLVTALLLTAALLITMLGTAISADPDSPLLFPVTPPPTTSPAVTSTSAAPDSPTPAPAGDLGYSTMVYDPFGDGTEHDDELPLLRDGDSATAWRTEQYYDPLPLLKSGVGVVFTVDGIPAEIDMQATTGTRYSVAWSDTVPEDFSSWEIIASGSILAGRARIQVPERATGSWLLWLTDLPDRGDAFFAEIREVRFRQ
jgi:putative peptidoglycan lipid II flippase